MTEFDTAGTAAITIAFFLGVALGGLYFGALWFTVSRLAHTRRPALLMVASLSARLALLLIGFYVILDGAHWDRLLAALLGFVAVRTVLIRKLGPAREGKAESANTEAPS